MGKERVNFFWSLITTGYKKLFIGKNRRYYMLPVVIIIFISVCSLKFYFCCDSFSFSIIFCTEYALVFD